MKDRGMLKEIQSNSSNAMGASCAAVFILVAAIILGAFALISIQSDMTRVVTKLNSVDRKVREIDNEIFSIDLDTDYIRSRVNNCK